MMDQQSTKDLIISAYTNYDWNKLKYWANSIDRCGFNGDKVMIAYNSTRDTVQRLTDLGFSVMTFQQDPAGNFIWPGNLVIVVQRFFNLWQYLDSLPENQYRFIISTDCKDVIFQKNPSAWLEENLGDSQLVASCESIRYRDEPWGADNLKGSYPWVNNRVFDNPIWNCGVQAGRMAAIKDLWLQIWSFSHAARRHNPDQAAYNMLINSVAYQHITKFAMSDDGWACQAGTTVDPEKIDSFRPNLIEPEPKWNGMRSFTSTGIEHVVVHQWDRIPAWHQAIETQYG